MAFTSEVLFLCWGVTTKKCFIVKQESYQGGIKEKPASYSRSLYDGSLQRVYAPATIRRFIAILAVYDVAQSGTHSDGTDSVSFGSISDLESAWTATDLQAKSFEDAAYWDCEWDSSYLPQVVYDPIRNLADFQVSLVER